MMGGRRGRDRNVVVITTRIISAYHHIRCEFAPRSWRCVLDATYVIKLVSDLRQDDDFLRVLWFHPPIKLTATITLKYC